MTVVTLLLTCACVGLCHGQADQDRASAAPWRWPLTPTPQVVRPFEPPDLPWAAGHRGVDLAADPGRPVYAAGNGRVTFAARLAGRGVVAVRHSRCHTTYLPIRPSVSAGQWVRAGERIGTVEHLPEHCGRRTCLHWGARQGLAYVDPLSLLGRPWTRLLPVWGIAASHAPRTAGPAVPHRTPVIRRREGTDAQDPPLERVGGAPPAAATAMTGTAATVTMLLLTVPRPGHRVPPLRTATNAATARRRPERVRRAGGPGGRSA